MIFLKIDTDGVYQTGEKVRIDCSKSFKSIDEAALTSVEIDPGNGYISLGAPALTDTSLWFLDWQYSSDGTQTLKIRVNGTEELEKTIEIISSVDDALFSSDEDLSTLEPDIMKWLPNGRSTWNNVHRKAQDSIMFELNKSKIFNADGSVLLKTQILDKQETKEWSIYLCLHYIFKGISNQVDDVFSAKAISYEAKAKEAKEYCFNILRIDVNKNSTIDEGEYGQFRSITLSR